jgi:uncharacterized protein YqfA (UPF0365 family)
MSYPIGPYLAQGADGIDFLSWGIGIVLLIFVVFLIFASKFLNLWIQTTLTKADIGLLTLVGMSLRKVNPTVMARARISAVQAGIETGVQELEAHYLAGGNVLRVVTALIAADRANLDLKFPQACAIDLAGRDVLEAVQMCVNPKVIDCPTTGRVAAMAKDGIQVLARARVTVRTNIQRLVGGATEETIIARVGEGIVSTIGSSNAYQDVLKNPGNISEAVLGRGLDAGTAFEILSIDIADVDIGENIGAKLQTDQAEADKRIAQARAEERRAMAVASEQEHIAQMVANRAELVLAESQVPLAMAGAFRSGNLGILDSMRVGRPTTMAGGTASTNS